MDPSRVICKVEDSFDSKYNNNLEVKKYEAIDTPGSPRSKRNYLRRGGDKEYDVFKSNSSNISKDISSNISKHLSDPFKENPSETFTKCGIILANIDAVYNFTGQEDGYLVPQNTKEFNYVCLNFNKSYINYLQYRLPIGVGFAPCVKESKKEGLDSRILNSSCDSNSLVNYVLEIVPYVDLVLSSEIDYKNNLIKALKLCKPGGTFISKIDENLNELNYQYITALSFKTFSIFKPLSEDLNSPYSYIVAEGYDGNSLDWVDLLERDKTDIDVPESFQSYVNDYYKSLDDLRKNLKDSYNVYKCLAIWNIF